ncbi:PREDICTED: uncharacterized protein LOC105149214 [Acromyrmex echinatior]|uniref:uncharacterized protein LOC105149214 n=1 Tax=Acromyrmex echinatior TaxID=103372 RepID=UPI000580F7B1|nr:PREDICTED: uncharacterized protein LOC105149214 [Acromyrmex echinatior]
MCTAACLVTENALADNYRNLLHCARESSALEHKHEEVRDGDSVKAISTRLLGLVAVITPISITRHPVIVGLQREDDNKENGSQGFGRYGSQILTGHYGRLIDQRYMVDHSRTHP